MNTIPKSVIALLTAMGCFSAVAIAAELPLSKLDLSRMEIGWGQPGTGKSVEGKPLKIADQSYIGGIGTHADSSFSSVDLLEEPYLGELPRKAGT